MFSDDVEGLSDFDTCDEELEPVENTCVNNLVNYSETNLNKFKQKGTTRLTETNRVNITLHAHKIKLLQLITFQFYIKYNKYIPRM